MGRCSAGGFSTWPARQAGVDADDGDGDDLFILRCQPMCMRDLAGPADERDPEEWPHETLEGSNVQSLAGGVLRMSEDALDGYFGLGSPACLDPGYNHGLWDSARRPTAGEPASR